MNDHLDKLAGISNRELQITLSNLARQAYAYSYLKLGFSILRDINSTNVYVCNIYQEEVNRYKHLETKVNTRLSMLSNEAHKRGIIFKKGGE